MPQRRSRSTSVVRSFERVAPAAAAGRADADHLTGPDRLGVGERVDLTFVGATEVDGDAERHTGLASLDPPAGEDRAVGDAHEVRVLEHPDLLLVAEPTAVAPGAAGVDGQPEPLDDEREAALGELGRQVARVGHDVDGVLAVGVVAPAGAAAEHLAHEVVVAVAVLAVDPGVADRLLVGRHPAVDGLGDHAGQHPEQPQDDEGPRVGRRGEDRRQQRALVGEAHLDQRHDALVDVELGHPLGGVGEVAQDRGEPLLEEVAADVVTAVVDRVPWPAVPCR